VSAAHSVAGSLKREAAAQQRAVQAYIAAIDLALCKEYPYFSPMITSRLTSKAQTTVPQPVRAALGLRPGDELAYAIEDGRVVLTRARPETAGDDPFRTFAEWDSPADTQAYAGL
jgi:antitoxin PrlF